MKSRKIKNSIALLGGLTIISIFSSCNDWLEPKPLSFFTPENTYVNAEGLYSALTACERNMRHEFCGDPIAQATEMIQSDICVDGYTEAAGSQIDMDQAFLPSANLNSSVGTMVGWYWEQSYFALKYANTVVSRIDEAEFKNEEERNAVLGAAYFQRAYRYYKLTHQFGDVPYIDVEYTAPKYDFYTYDRWSILEKCKEELEFAYKWVPENVDRGRTSKSACGVLLMKVCMALCDWDRAIEVGKEIVAKHPLMKERFTANKNKPGTNLMFDLHSVEAKLDPSNTEGLMYVVSYPEVEGSDRMQIMRHSVPFWSSGSIKTPDGDLGTALLVDPSETDPELDLNQLYGRGIGHIRPTNYFQYDIWTDKERNDLRSVHNRDSWRDVSDLRYNNPKLKQSGSKWYGKNIIKPVNMSVVDSIRCWYQWPQYKLHIPDPLHPEEVRGGESPWYIYRSAEVYLMLGECYYWKGENGLAADMLNEVRTRAGAEKLISSDINIGAVLDERARELYYEENRHVELVRISYTYARTGKPCEVFGDRVYRLDNISGPGGTHSNVKEEGYNFFYDWVMAKNNFYNKGIKVKFGEYKMSVHHILWPVPTKAIDSSIQGHINQNVGYAGAENNIKPLKVGETFPQVK